MKLQSLFFAVILSLISFSASAEIVNLNKANASALQHYLKGIGEKKAKSIVQYRQQHKKFKSVEEIQEVKGIGEGIYQKIKKNLSLTKGVTVVPEKKKVKAKKVTKKKTKAVTKTNKKKKTLRKSLIKAKVECRYQLKEPGLTWFFYARY